MSLHCEERTYAQSCRTAIEDEDHLHRIQDAVFRIRNNNTMHEIYAFELGSADAKRV